ncbi:hypothetical protein T05_10278 [Trichinella murrelli]|uniref:Uncharacterized protein n=1 Tax=Trichinella murrelli TaxID=144512 RepID=A0A0V0U7E5_9BILA|nr:hypothetical protein T05_10278 [Trichinella murrelli]
MVSPMSSTVHPTRHHPRCSTPLMLAIFPSFSNISHYHHHHHLGSARWTCIKETNTSGLVYNNRRKRLFRVNESFIQTDDLALFLLNRRVSL